MNTPYIYIYISFRVSASSVAPVEWGSEQLFFLLSSIPLAVSVSLLIGHSCQLQPSNTLYLSVGWLQQLFFSLRCNGLRYLTSEVSQDVARPEAYLSVQGRTYIVPLASCRGSRRGVWCSPFPLQPHLRAQPFPCRPDQ